MFFREACVLKLHTAQALCLVFIRSPAWLAPELGLPMKQPWLLLAATLRSSRIGSPGLLYQLLHIWWLKQQKLIFSQFWKPEV